MKREIFLKVILVLMIVSVLFTIPVKSFATGNFNNFFNDGDESGNESGNESGDNSENNSGSEEDDDVTDLGGRDDLKEENPPATEPEIKPEENPPATEPETKPEEKPQEPKPSQQPEQELPKAGLAEDTMLITTVLVLGTIAIITYKKVNEYKNI